MAPIHAPKMAEYQYDSRQPRQTAQIKIRMLLKMQPNQGLLCLLFGNPFLKTNILFENRERKVL